MSGELNQKPNMKKHTDFYERKIQNFLKLLGIYMRLEVLFCNPYLLGKLNKFK
jgi:hypothetical protein